MNAKDERSNPVRVNDARPLWITPDQTYTTRSIANLPRILRSGRAQSQPMTGKETRVRLTGPRTYTLTAASGASALQRYVAQVDLPASMAAGEYTIEVSRDGATWVGLIDTGTICAAKAACGGESRTGSERQSARLSMRKGR